MLAIGANGSHLQLEALPKLDHPITSAWSYGLPQSCPRLDSFSKGLGQVGTWKAPATSLFLAPCSPHVYFVEWWKWEVGQNSPPSSKLRVVGFSYLR